ncbi:MAG: xanthine dehydrogenase family protein subunit M [Pseudomonadota bacterium]
MRNVFIPQDLQELWHVLSENPDTVCYAGGTDLLVRMRSGALDPVSLTWLDRIGDLKGVHDFGEEVFIGACTTHSALLSDPLIGEHFPVLRKAVSVLGSPQVRNMGTIGGNIVTASPAGDTLPPLFLLEAELELRTCGSSRRIPIDRFIRGPGDTALAPSEILAGLWLKKSGRFNIQHYEKVGRRKAMAVSIISLAAMMRLSGEGIVEEAKFAWGSAGPTIVRSPEAESLLKGSPLSHAALEESARIARQAVRSIDDVRAGAEYRRALAGNLLFRLLQFSPVK